ncbi:MAG TPA: hypothetical protein VLH77_02780, partial [Gammaproteobacteria bacterium]|nr:hypothetical protein [Gammaproteobacteria bacterium]
LSLFFWGLNVFAAELPDPCGGPSAILALVDRPSAADSACVVPFEKGIIEAGFQYQNLKGSKRGYNLPETVLRLGLPAKTELVILFPNYFRQTVQPHAGWGPTTIGLKHELGYNEKWLASIEGLVIWPSGGAAFGSDGTGGIINGIIDYSLSPSLDLTFMLGVSTQALPYGASGQRFNSVNPDLVLAWLVTPKFQTYAEIYGQSKTGPSEGAGFNADAGIQYAWTPNLVTDLELGQRISGKLGSFNNYVGTGLAWLF